MLDLSIIKLKNVCSLSAYLRGDRQKRWHLEPHMILSCVKQCLMLPRSHLEELTVSFKVPKLSSWNAGSWEVFEEDVGLGYMVLFWLNCTIYQAYEKKASTRWRFDLGHKKNFEQVMESFVLDLCAFVLGLYVSPATGNPVVHSINFDWHDILALSTISQQLCYDSWDPGLNARIMFSVWTSGDTRSKPSMICCIGKSDVIVIHWGASVPWIWWQSAESTQILMSIRRFSWRLNGTAI